MRGPAVFLVLLLCLQWTWARGESEGVTGNDITERERDQSRSQSGITTDIWTELKELRDMAIEHRTKIEKLEQENTATQARLTASESKNAVLEARLSSNENLVKELQKENIVLGAKISASNNKMEELKRDNAVLEVKMNTSENVVAELRRNNMDLLVRVTASENKNTVLETRMSSSENEVEELKREKAVLETKMSSSENEVEELKREKAVLETRMSSSENEVEELKRENADLLARVTASENKNTVLETRMSSSENEVEELKRENADRPKVAFSVGLTDAGRVGTFNTDITLKFSKVFTNIGQAYSTTTGVFTASVRGVYYFRFSLWDVSSSNSMGAQLYHNDKMMMWNYDSSSSTYGTVSNALVLQLEKGDVVYMVLPTGYRLYDNVDNHNIFSGFLLFAL